MGVLIHHDSVETAILPGGGRRQRLIDGDRVAGTRCLFDRIVLDAGTSLQIRPGDSGVVWGQLLRGSAAIGSSGDERTLAELDALFLPPGSDAWLASAEGAELVTLTVPAAIELDPSLAAVRPEPRFVDLSLEPLLQSQHDERMRIYMASKSLFGTTALTGEIVIFPPRTAGKNHHHTGAEHFQYIMRGTGTAFLDEQPHPIRAGDLVYKFEGERHFVQNDPDAEMAFVEFFVPGTWETVWADPARACTWAPTGTNLEGGAPSREIAAHTSDGTVHDGV